MRPPRRRSAAARGRPSGNEARPSLSPPLPTVAPTRVPTVHSLPPSLPARRGRPRPAPPTRAPHLAPPVPGVWLLRLGARVLCCGQRDVSRVTRLHQHNEAAGVQHRPHETLQCTCLTRRADTGRCDLRQHDAARELTARGAHPRCHPAPPPQPLRPARCPLRSSHPRLVPPIPYRSPYCMPVALQWFQRPGPRPPASPRTPHPLPPALLYARCSDTSGIAQPTLDFGARPRPVASRPAL